MRLALFAILISFASFGQNTETNWNTDLESANQKAQSNNQYILLKFSGSDWCVNCIKLDRKVLKSTDFLSFAKNNLVLLEADFPAKKKNKLSGELQKQNEALAEKYNPNGRFPLLLIIDHNGNLIQEIKHPKNNTQAYISAIQKAISK